MPLLAILVGDTMVLFIERAKNRIRDTWVKYQDYKFKARVNDILRSVDFIGRYMNKTDTRTEDGKSSEVTNTEITYVENVNDPNAKYAVYSNIFEYFNTNSVLSTIRYVLRSYTVMKGVNIEPKFVTKCPKCSTEYEYYVEKCEVCNEDTVEPSEQRKNKIKKLFKKVNKNGETINEIIMRSKDDLTMYDEAYFFIKKTYTLDKVNKKIQSTRPKEIYVQNPAYMGFYMNANGKLGYNEQGYKMLTCVQHRSFVTSEDKETTCPKCGYKLYPTTYYSQLIQSPTNRSKKYHYIGGEILRIKEYSTGQGASKPPILSVMPELRTLIEMTRYIHKWYDGTIIRQNLLFVNTNNIASLENAIAKQAILQAENPNRIVPLGVSSNKTGDVAKLIEINKTPDQLELIDTRSEYIRRISGAWGVQPIFHGEKAGSIGRDSLQFAVTNNAVMMTQFIYSQKVFPWILSQFGIHDWSVYLVEPEKRDTLAKLELMSKQLDVAIKMSSIGYSPQLVVDDAGNISFRYKPGESQMDKYPNLGVKLPDRTQLPQQRFDKFKQKERVNGEPYTKLPSKYDQYVSGAPDAKSLDRANSSAQLVVNGNTPNIPHDVYKSNVMQYVTVDISSGVGDENEYSTEVPIRGKLLKIVPTSKAPTNLVVLNEFNEEIVNVKVTGKPIYIPEKYSYVTNKLYIKTAKTQEPVSFGITILYLPYFVSGSGGDN